MMICLDCNNCRSIKEKDGVYGINCTEHGEFKLHSDYVDTFNCEDFDESIPVTPQRDNIIIILKCGRDIPLYDKDITCNDDMQRRIQSAENWVEFDGMLFNVDEIAVFSYVG